MLRSSSNLPAKAATPHSSGFSLIEVMVAVSIAAGVISLLVPVLLRQVAVGEEANRLTAVEAVVSRDLDWFADYAKIWKLKSGSYPTSGTTALTKAITKTETDPITESAAIYEPRPVDCSTGLASPFLADAERLPLRQPDRPNLYLPPYAINVSSTTQILASSGGVSNLYVTRELAAAGNRILIYYYTTTDPNSVGLNYTREASVLVEAAAWCDRLQ